MIKLPELPYAEDALEPQISKETIKFHYGKHHKGYIDNLNKLIIGTRFEGKSIEQILASVDSGIIFNNAAQAANHEFFWNCLTPNGKPINPDSKLAKAINKKFGSFDKFKKEFKEKATKIFGSGWCWLSRDDEYVQIETTRNANRCSDRPLLVCDLWEHSYYLDHQNDRGAYIDAFFEIVNWEFVEKQFEIA